MAGLGVQGMFLPTPYGSTSTEWVNTIRFCIILFQVTEQLLSQGYQKMKASLGVDDTGSPTHAQAEFGQDKAYLSAALYCDKILRMKEDGNTWSTCS